MIVESNTICAIATAHGKGAIAVIRISGEKTKEIISAIFHPYKKQTDWLQEGYKIHYGEIRNNGETIDSVLVSVFNSPNSYTGEDSVEISCHASSYIQNEILNLLIENGARLAHPGEFTQRAFLNKKLDLSQAEAVADLIASDSAASHNLAISQMKGGYAKELKDLRDVLLNFLSLLELELDFSEEDLEFADRSQLMGLCNDLTKRVEKLVASFKLGNAIKQGVPVCIVGEPNVGKSTLLNAILNEDKAIVSSIPGTTRDVIEDTIVIGGVTFRFVDTAGIRETDNEIEKIGIQRTFENIDKANFIFVLFDITADKKDIQQTISEIKRRTKDKKIFLIINKIDLVPDYQKAITKDDFQGMSDNDEFLYISAKENKYVDLLIEKLLAEVNASSISQEDAIVTNFRHYEALQHALESLHNIDEGFQNGLTNDLISLELRQVLHYLGEITGEISEEEMLGNIFAHFCVGK
ncbi:MAG: tRNA uridine-5-carboxymethylaminomethyl(34) synthesis GTPase MnmE [Bacteroidales bacterium]|nr:tRNA uridine-5-carboxymethylaminomethyl(34) synthesis GTPase MnmE [Bacteroidales bacterium]